MGEIIVETMQSYNTYVGSVKEGIGQIISHFRNEKIEEGLALVNLFSEGVIWMVEVNTKMCELGYHSNFNITEINEFLIEINEGLLAKDYILVADLFEYEIIGFFEDIDLYQIN